MRVKHDCQMAEIIDHYLKFVVVIDQPLCLVHVACEKRGEQLCPKRGYM